MALGSAWARARSHPTFVRDFSRYLLVWATWLPPIIWFNLNVAQLTVISGPSMYPFLNDNYNQSQKRDLCLVYKLYAQENLQRGMVVTFKNPLRPGVSTVKRVVGLEGDVVHTRAPFPNAYIRVPPGHIWVEGDEGGKLTLDSNTYGPISARLVTGQITHILWPWRKAGKVKWWEHGDRVGVVRE